MKAMIWTAYGPPDVLELREIARPTPKDGEVLIAVHGATVTAGDCELRILKFPVWLKLPLRLYIGWGKPTRVFILGQELAGIVQAVGKNVDAFKPGDRVFGTTGFHFSAHAEYICLPAKSQDAMLETMPTNMGYEQAAAVPTGGLEAYHFLSHAQVHPGHRVLIYGAGGTIGTFAVQLAKYMGADVTAVDRAEKLELLRSLGADYVIDYQREDFTRNGETYDVIFDVVGKSSFSGSVSSLKEPGILMIANPTVTSMLRGLWVSLTSKKRVLTAFWSRNPGDLLSIKQLIEAGKIRSVIDRSYSLEELAEAHRYVESGQKKGNVVVTIRHQDKA